MAGGGLFLNKFSGALLIFAHNLLLAATFYAACAVFKPFLGFASFEQ